jgi:hypothetical protein
MPRWMRALPLRYTPASDSLRDSPFMMALPFVGLFVAVLLAWGGRRIASLLVWGGSMLLTLILFRLHATDVLPLVF